MANASRIPPFRASVLVLAVAVATALTLTAVAEAKWSPGSYVGTGGSEDCIEFTAAGSAIEALSAGACEWRFTCGANGSRGAPGFGWRKVALARSGRFEAHATDGEFGTVKLIWDVTGHVEGRRARGTFRFHYGTVCDTGVIKWQAERQSLAGGPYTVTRGEPLRFDAPSPKTKGLRYDWRLKPAGDCPQGAALANSRYTQRRPRFGAVLCGLKVRLIMRDQNGEERSGRTTVRVQQRTDPMWRVKRPAFIPRETATMLPIFQAPLASTSGLTFGALRCPGPSDLKVFCRGQRYVIARVKDPKGPFDEWSYVKRPAPDLALLQIAYLNPHLEPGAPPLSPGQPNWFGYNMMKGIDVMAYRAHTIAHETTGWKNTPRSGHFQAIVDALEDDDAHHDPRRYLETRVGPDRQVFETTTDDCLGEIERQIKAYADDPLASPKTGVTGFWLWSPATAQWQQAGVDDPAPAAFRPIPPIPCLDAP